ncbi:hypothetical protein V8C40DRAFT_251590 [Trichoderma camerunense]
MPIPSHTWWGQGKEARRIPSIEPAGSCKPWLASRLGAADQGRCRADKQALNNAYIEFLKSRGRKEGERQNTPQKEQLDATVHSAIEAQYMYQKGISACALHLALELESNGRKGEAGLLFASGLSAQAK